MPFYQADTEPVRAILTCDCSAECSELQFQVDDDPVLHVYVSARPRWPLNLRVRLRDAWRILRSGSLGPDCMIVEVPALRGLTDWLLEVLREDDAEGEEGEA